MGSVILARTIFIREGSWEVIDLYSSVFTKYARPLVLNK